MPDVIDYTFMGFGVFAFAVASFAIWKSPYRQYEHKPVEPELVEAWHNEQVLNEDAQSILNWNQVPEDDRVKCVDHLRYAMSDDLGLMLLWTWRREAESGLPIGHGDPWFHDGVGSFVRKTLREVMADDRLPALVDPETDEPVQSWDSYYLGAIYDLIEQELE